MKRAAASILGLILALTLMIPAMAAEHMVGDTYIRILGNNGDVTVGVRTTYGQVTRVDGALIRDDRYDFVYTADGSRWFSAGRAESDLWYGSYDGKQFLAWSHYASTPSWRSADGRVWEKIGEKDREDYPAPQHGVSTARGIRFSVDGQGKVWAEGKGNRAELTAFSAFRSQGYLPADIQAYPVAGGGVRVVAYSRYGYDTSYEVTYTSQNLKTILDNGQVPVRVALDGTVLTFPTAPYQVKGCTMAPLRTLAEEFGYTFSYDAKTQTAVCTKDESSITVTVGKTSAQVTGREGVPMAVAPELKGGILCVPVRFWSDAAGCQDRWDSSNCTLWIRRS